jgi:hypothetical protein
MGLVDSFKFAFEGMILAAILGGIIVGLWPTLSSYYSNSIFSAGALILIMFGLLPLVFVYAIIRGMMDKARQEDEPQMGAF